MHRYLLFVAAMAIAVGVSARSKVTWVIDAGHGGHDYGCVKGSTAEKTITLAVAKEVGRLVEKNLKDVKVAYTREKDKYLTLQERCDIANKRGAQLFISIHANSSRNPMACGTETYFSTNVPQKGANWGKSEMLALLMQKHYKSHGRTVSRGVKQRALYVIEHTNMPGVLTEIGFCTNRTEDAFINSKDGQSQLAYAIFEALKEWQEKASNGVNRNELLAMRYAHWDPMNVIAPTQNVVVQSIVVEEITPEEQEVIEVTAEPVDSVPATAQATEPKEEANYPTLPYFAVQVFTTSTAISPDDKRLKGLKDIRVIPVDGRFKTITGRADTYPDAKALLTKVRELFPEAFIVAFDGDKQITTAEAIEILKKKQ